MIGLIIVKINNNKEIVSIQSEKQLMDIYNSERREELPLWKKIIL